MSNVTTGLFKKDTRLYYVDTDIAVLDNPYNGGRPIVVMRHFGVPNEIEQSQIDRVLKTLNMKPVGASRLREDGLWYQQIEEVKDAREKM